MLFRVPTKCTHYGGKIKEEKERKKGKKTAKHLMDGSVLYREEAESNPLGLYDVHTAETDLKTVLNSHRRDFCLLIGANNAGSSHGHQQTLPKLTLDFLFTGTSTSIIMSRTVTAVFEIPL